MSLTKVTKENMVPICRKGNNITYYIRILFSLHSHQERKKCDT